MAPLQQVVAMDNAREQVLGQFGSVTGPAKVLEVLQDGASFGHAVSAGRHLWKAIQVVISVVVLCVKRCLVLQVEDAQRDTRGQGAQARSPLEGRTSRCSVPEFVPVCFSSNSWSSG